MSSPHGTCYEMVVASFHDFEPICGFDLVRAPDGLVYCPSCDLALLISTWGTNSQISLDLVGRNSHEGVL